jgi:1,2-diacylglycerol 3-alpha-glucosyltransferase
VNLPKEVIRKKLDIPENKTVLLVVCRVSKEKNLSLIIKSISQLSDHHLLMVVGGGNYEKQVKELAVKEGVIDKIRFIGLVEHEKLGIYYQAADLFVYSSTTETQGLIFLEALSFGLSIVAVNSEASREWVSKDMGVLTENTPEDFAKGILTFKKKGLKITSKTVIDYSKQSNVTMTARKLLNEYELLRKRYGPGNRLLETG